MVKGDYVPPYLRRPGRSPGDVEMQFFATCHQNYIVNIQYNVYTYSIY